MINKYIKDAQQLIDDVYRNGGFAVNGYGYLSSGFGGGITMETAHRLLQVRGGLQFLEAYGAIEEVNSIYKEVGEAIIADPNRYPLSSEDKDFINEKRISFTNSF